MYSVELYNRGRRACHVDGMSKSEAARMFGIDRKTVAKILKHSVPPGYRRMRPPARPKLDPFIPIIDQILEDDKGQLRKQRHTAKRIYERLREEHGFTGGITIVTDYVREKKRRSREVFVPMAHPPGQAQVDFGEAVGVIGGVRRKLHYFARSLPHSDALFIKTYLAETTEVFCDGHVAAFVFFGGVPASILYDNTSIAVAKILGEGTRKRTRAFSLVQSHYLFEDRFGRRGKGNDKGNVEGVIGCAFVIAEVQPDRIQHVLKQTGWKVPFHEVDSDVVDQLRVVAEGGQDVLREPRLQSAVTRFGEVQIAVGVLFMGLDPPDVIVGKAGVGVDYARLGVEGSVSLDERADGVFGIGEGDALGVLVL